MYKACVVGHPVAHSLSPAMHNVAYKELGINCRYKAIDVLPEEFSKFMERVITSLLVLV